MKMGKTGKKHRRLQEQQKVFIMGLQVLCTEFLSVYSDRIYSPIAIRRGQ